MRKVVSSFLGNAREIKGVTTHEELVEILVISSRNKYDSFKHVFEPVRLSYNTKTAIIETSVDCKISTSLDLVKDGNDDEYHINITVAEITGTIKKIMSNGSEKVLFRTIATVNDFGQDVDSILKTKEVICDKIAMYVDAPHVKEYYFKAGTGLPVDMWIVSKYKKFRNAFKIKTADYGSSALSMFDNGLAKALKLF